MYFARDLSIMLVILPTLIFLHGVTLAGWGGVAGGVGVAGLGWAALGCGRVAVCVGWVEGAMGGGQRTKDVNILAY